MLYQNSYLSVTAFPLQQKQLLSSFYLNCRQGGNLFPLCGIESKDQSLMISSLICYIGLYNIQQSMSWTLNAWWKSDTFQQVNTRQVELDHIIKADLLYVKVFWIFTFFQNTSNQIKAENEVNASLSIIQFKPVLFWSKVSHSIYPWEYKCSSSACIFKQNREERG